MTTAKQVDVCCGGPGREHEVSMASGHAVARPLAKRVMMSSYLKSLNPLDLKLVREGAVVFNVIHGTYGEDGTLQKNSMQRGSPTLVRRPPRVDCAWIKQRRKRSQKMQASRFRGVSK